MSLFTLLKKLARKNYILNVRIGHHGKTINPEASKMSTSDSFYLRSFHEKSLYLLEENDREILHNILKNYQQYHDVSYILKNYS